MPLPEGSLVRKNSSVGPLLSTERGINEEVHSVPSTNNFSTKYMPGPWLCATTFSVVKFETAAAWFEAPSAVAVAEVIVWANVLRRMVAFATRGAPIRKVPPVPAFGKKPRLAKSNQVVMAP